MTSWNLGFEARVPSCSLRGDLSAGQWKTEPSEPPAGGPSWVTYR